MELPGTCRVLSLCSCGFPLQCFSSVVGPNGSGKSNVIDAMLFVFGEARKAGPSQSVQVPFLPLAVRS